MPRYKSGDSVIWSGEPDPKVSYKVVEWQSKNGPGGAYWLRNQAGEDAVASEDEMHLKSEDVAGDILHLLIESDALTDQEQPTVSFNDIRKAFESTFGSFSDADMVAAANAVGIETAETVLPVCREWLRGFRACIAFHSPQPEVCDECSERSCGDELHMTPREHLDGQGCERCYPSESGNVVG